MNLNKRDEKFVKICKKAKITTEQAFDFIEQIKKLTLQKRSNSLFIRGFGTIEVHKYKGHMVGNKYTGERFLSPSYKRIKIKLNRDFQNKLNNK
jgi:nucleoid DNA-binding protein